MDYFVDVHVLPDLEFSPPTLMSATYSKLHHALVSLGRNDIGVSFPKADKTPGTVLRLHSSKEALETLLREPWLQGLRDYTRVNGPSPVPSTASYVQVRRVQPKQSASRLRRAVRRKALQEHEAEMLLATRPQLNRPFLRLKSQSTGQSFPLFFEQGEPQAKPVKGSYGAYGISQTATVPWF